MIKGKKLITIMTTVAVAFTLFTGCADKGTEEEKFVTEDTVSDEEIIEEKDYLSVQTSIAYSSGDTKNWTYGNQRKEFPDKETCYARIASTAVTSSKIGRGNGDPIEVRYRFTGTKKCDVSISDGKAQQVDSGDRNVTEFVRTITVSKAKNAREDIMIFRYSPKGADELILEVIYDDQVAEKYDDYNTVYFD